MLPLLALLIAPRAAAQDLADPTWYAGRLVSSVEIVAGEGALLDEDLRPLLRATESRPLDPMVVQLDLRTLYRVTPLAAIEADIVPWPVYDDRIGDVTLGAKVRYILYPSPRVADVRVQGARRVRAREVLRYARLNEGDAFDAALDPPEVDDRVTRALQARGFPDASVEVESFAAADDPFRREVWIRVDEGQPRLLERIDVRGAPEGLSPQRIARWARGAGLKRGDPIAEDALTRARFVLRRKLARLSPGPAADALLGPRLIRGLTRAGVLPPGGWVDARVIVEAEPSAQGGVVARVDLDAGRRLDVRASGVAASVARDALGVDERLRLTRGFLEDAPRRVEDSLAIRGYNAASAEVSLRETADVQVLEVTVDRGPRHRRKPFTFEGNTTLSDTQLRTVLNQASPDVLRRRRQTPAALDAGVQAVTDLYRSVGHDAVDVQADPPRYRRRRPLLSLDRSRRWITQNLRITEGPRTRLATVAVEGAADGVDLPGLQATLAALEGGPYSPQGLQGLAQRIVDAHRAEGFLDADARVRATPTEAGFAARILVLPGDRVLLRSFATRGNRRVPSRYLRRTLAPPLGEPLDARTLDDIRQRLYDLGMFSAVELTLIGDDAARDLVVDLRERPRHTLETGFGLASDQGVRALGRWTMRNLFGPADRIDTNALVGLRFGPGAGGLGLLPAFRTPEYRLGSTYTLPLSRVTEVALSLVGQEELQERNWRLLRRAVGLQWVYQPRRATLLQLRARLEHRRLAGADPGALLATDVWADPALRLPSAPSVDTRGRLVDQIELVWLDDHRDNPLQPTRGTVASTRVAFSPQIVQPAYARHLRVPLFAAEARGAIVLPVGPLSLRLNAEGGHQRVVPIGTIASFDVDGEPVGPAVPVEERYRLGGTASLRGFRRDGVGPQQQVRQLDLAWPDALGPTIADTLRLDDSRFVPTGGDTFARITADLLVPLPALGLTDWEGYDLALFVDVGQAWFAAKTAATPPRVGEPIVRGAAGVGLRVLTPVGPLQTDLAFNPLPIRALREPVARLHLSLGTLF